jgi:GMP synthase (glutamine-hydrolysing)
MSATARSAANSEASAAVQTAKAAEKRQPMSKSELGGIIVLDFGGQYTQLIARRIREQQVFSAILPCTAKIEEIRAYQPVGIVLSGSPCSVYDPAAPICDPGVLSLGVPVLGICYGLQWISHTLGGKVERAERREYGPAEIDLRDGSALFAGLPRRLKIWMSHGDHVRALPPGFQITGVSANGLSAAEDPVRRIFAVQFHPEVRHTERGSEILRNFVFEVCGARPNWSGASFISETVEAIRKQVGRGRAICALSGGVDSAVAAALVHRAIGNRLINIFVDTGLLRKNEFPDTIDLLENRVGLRVVGVNAADRFLARLKGVTDPEVKRKHVGAEFINVFAEQARQLGEIRYLVQGTLYPDVIESVPVRGPSATIKTHHNVGGLPADLPFELIEPLRELFKDEVRRIGRELGLPEEILTKQPFPGPGLAVRLLGEVVPERLETLRGADAIVVEEIRRAGLYETTWQAFAVLLPVRSVGVMGDERSYGDTVAIRVVTSEDAMTADWARVPYDALERMSARIVNEVAGVNRVVYDISSKPPSTIEWE